MSCTQEDWRGYLEINGVYTFIIPLKRVNNIKFKKLSKIKCIQAYWFWNFRDLWKYSVGSTCLIKTSLLYLDLKLQKPPSDVFCLFDWKYKDRVWQVSWQGKPGVAAWASVQEKWKKVEDHESCLPLLEKVLCNWKPGLGRAVMTHVDIIFVVH